MAGKNNKNAKNSSQKPSNTLRNEESSTRLGTLSINDTNNPIPILSETDPKEIAELKASAEQIKDSVNNTSFKVTSIEDAVAADTELNKVVSEVISILSHDHEKKKLQNALNTLSANEMQELITRLKNDTSQEKKIKLETEDIIILHEHIEKKKQAAEDNLRSYAVDTTKDESNVEATSSNNTEVTTTLETIHLEITSYKEISKELNNIIIKEITQKVQPKDGLNSIQEIASPVSVASLSQNIALLEQSEKIKTLINLVADTALENTNDQIIVSLKTQIAKISNILLQQKENNQWQEALTVLAQHPEAATLLPSADIVMINNKIQDIGVKDAKEINDLTTHYDNAKKALSQLIKVRIPKTGQDTNIDQTLVTETVEKATKEVEEARQAVRLAREKVNEIQAERKQNQFDNVENLLSSVAPAAKQETEKKEATKQQNKELGATLQAAEQSLDNAKTHLEKCKLTLKQLQDAQAQKNEAEKQLNEAKEQNALSEQLTQSFTALLTARKELVMQKASALVEKLSNALPQPSKDNTSLRALLTITPYSPDEIAKQYKSLTDAQEILQELRLCKASKGAQATPVDTVKAQQSVSAEPAKVVASSSTEQVVNTEQSPATQQSLDGVITNLANAIEDGQKALKTVIESMHVSQMPDLSIAIKGGEKQKTSTFDDSITKVENELEERWRAFKKSYPLIGKPVNVIMKVPLIKDIASLVGYIATTPYVMCAAVVDKWQNNRQEYKANVEVRKSLLQELVISSNVQEKSK